MTEHDLHLIEIGEKAGTLIERAKIVAWLREQGGHHGDIYEEAAADIEAGGHLK